MDPPALDVQSATPENANILIVDDRPANLLVLRSMLEELGQNVITAHSGYEALKHLLEREFAVILLDVNMPGLDGLETAALIRSRAKSRHVPIIFITADYTDEVRTSKGYSLGAVDYMIKPVDAKWNMSAEEVARLQAVSAKSEAAVQYGSFGIGKGGLDTRAALFWAFVGIPLAWGVWKTLESAIKIL